MTPRSSPARQGLGAAWRALAHGASRALGVSLALAVMADAAWSSGREAPAGTERVFDHIREEPHLPEIARAHRLRQVAPKRAKWRPAGACVLGDFGFGRASVYLELGPGERLWLYDAPTAVPVGEGAPLVTLEFDAKSRLTVGCAGCDSRPQELRGSEDGVLGGLWLDVSGGRLRIREHGSRRELGAPSGIAVKDRLFVAVPTTELSCAASDLAAVAVFLPPDEARAWRRSVGRFGKRAPAPR